MNKNLLSSLPSYHVLINEMDGARVPLFREANAHIHTPYSFSAFDRLEKAFNMADDEEISVLGINDFLVTDGYEAFQYACMRHNIFPLFNIEFICLLREEQKSGIRINDPNNPGRIYISGKGLDYPFKAALRYKWHLSRIKRMSQKQIRSMTEKLNELVSQVNPSLTITYDEIKERFAEELVRERHLAKAVRHLALDNFTNAEDQQKFIESLYGGRKSRAGMTNIAALENEIRSNLLKAGGAAYVEEHKNSFPDLDKILKLIIHAGGIPCYPVLLDDTSGNFTEFENDPEKLYSSLINLGIGCIELIPGRNDLSVLNDFVEFFNKKEFIITFGTEHNTPEMTPLTVTSRGSVPIPDSLKQIAWEGVCVIAAHQYLRAQKRQGYILSDGTHSSNQRKELVKLGQVVIEYYLNRNQKSNQYPDERGN